MKLLKQIKTSLVAIIMIAAFVPNIAAAADNPKLSVNDIFNFEKQEDSDSEFNLVMNTFKDPDQMQTSLKALGAVSARAPWTLEIFDGYGEEGEETHPISGFREVFLMKNIQVNYTYGEDTDFDGRKYYEKFLSINFGSQELVDYFIETAKKAGFAEPGELKNSDEEDVDLDDTREYWWGAGIGYVICVHGYQVTFYLNVG